MKKLIIILLAMALLLCGCGTAQSASDTEAEINSAEPSPTPTRKPEPTPQPQDEGMSAEELLGREIADFALDFLGSKYKYGGKTPEEGFDCSGLVYYVYSQFGYSLARVANDQAKQGEEVAPEDLRAGDVLAF
ncbi:MAG: C40 family peptidase, partial [Oscillospiraceae bacterium]|nr:C40 family peptidase [Oscillospiraceae bacterium]